MRYEKLYTILKVLKLFQQMPSGAGWVKPTDIIRWSGLPQSTVYRYLKALEALKAVEAEDYKCRRIACKRYKITEYGLFVLPENKEMF